MKPRVLSHSLTHTLSHSHSLTLTLSLPHSTSHTPNCGVRHSSSSRLVHHAPQRTQRRTHMRSEATTQPARTDPVFCLHARLSIFHHLLESACVELQPSLFSCSSSSQEQPLLSPSLSPHRPHRPCCCQRLPPPLPPPPSRSRPWPLLRTSGVAPFLSTSSSS